MSLPVPGSVNQITVDWLKYALKDNPELDPSHLVGFETEQIGQQRGFYGEIFRTSLKYSNSHENKSIVLKFPPSDQVSTNNQRRENETIERIRETASFPGPNYLFIGSDVENDQYVLAMEDLSDSKPGDHAQGCSVVEARAVLQALAQLHAEWWNSPDLAHFTWSNDRRNRELAEADQSGYLEAWEPYLSLWQDHLDPGFLETAKATGPRIEELFTIQPSKSVTLNHGDTRLDNIFFQTQNSSKAAILIDWGVSSIRPPGWDVAYFIAWSLDVEDRRAHEHDLIDEYWNTLVNGGVTDYPKSELLEDIRLGMLSPILPTVRVGSIVDPSEPRIRDLAMAVFTRMTAALSDWNCHELLLNNQSSNATEK